MTRVTIVGRSSSHFTRVTRIFAAELGVESDLQVVRDLLATDAASFGGNPALKVPSLRIGADAWYGALPICRALWRRSGARPSVVWPEDLHTPLLSNAQELTTQAMTTEVALILGKAATSTADDSHRVKMRESLVRSLAWLDAHVDAALAAMPVRDLSFLEVTLFCLVEHLAFRDVVPTASYSALEAFRKTFASRPSAVATPFRFDP